MQEVRLCKGTQDSRHLTEVTILANLGRNPALFFREGSEGAWRESMLEPARRRARSRTP